MAGITPPAPAAGAAGYEVVGVTSIGSGFSYEEGVTAPAAVGAPVNFYHDFASVDPARTSVRYIPRDYAGDWSAAPDEKPAAWPVELIVPGHPLYATLGADDGLVIVESGLYALAIQARWAPWPTDDPYAYRVSADAIMSTDLVDWWNTNGLEMDVGAQFTSDLEGNLLNNQRSSDVQWLEAGTVIEPRMQFRLKAPSTGQGSASLGTTIMRIA